jgi:hypothetical protein
MKDINIPPIKRVPVKKPQALTGTLGLRRNLFSGFLYPQ